MIWLFVVRSDEDLVVFSQIWMEVFIQIWAWCGVIAKIQRRFGVHSYPMKNIQITSQRLRKTSAGLNLRPIRINPWLFAVGGGSFSLPFDVVGSGAGEHNPNLWTPLVAALVGQKSTLNPPPLLEIGSSLLARVPSHYIYFFFSSRI